MPPLIEFTTKGFYCPQADVYIDPWKPVKRAIITHAHSDHARNGHGHYLCHTHTKNILEHRLSKSIKIQTIGYRERIYMNGVEIMLYPAGHITGSAQIFLKNQEESWVISGDYKLQKDSLLEPFETVRCDHFVTESTFGLPVFQWKQQVQVFEQINKWWSKNAEENQPSILVAYSLGKAQRIIQNLDHSIGPVLTHGSVQRINECIVDSGLALKTTEELHEYNAEKHSRAMVVCPPGAIDSQWARNIKGAEQAFASGWMMLRGAKRRRGVEKAFVLSDHADWNDLNEAVFSTKAENIYVTHGYSSIYSKWLREKGLNARPVKSAFEGESIEDQNSES